MDRLETAVGKRFNVKPDVISSKRFTQESLWHFALSTGNLNPLFYDRTYALQSPHGRVIAPPTWFTEIIDPHIGAQAMYTELAATAVAYQGDRPAPAGGETSGPPYFYVDGLRSFNGAVGFSYVNDPEIGTTFDLVGEVSQVLPKQSSRLGDFAIVRGDLEYRDDAGQLLSEGYGSSVVYDLERATPAASDPATTNDSGTAQQPTVVAPIAAIRAVRRRGEAVRFWEDVEVGDEIDPLYKGTLDSAEIAVYSVKLGHNAASDEAIQRAWALLDSGHGAEAAALYRQIAIDPEYGFGVERHLNKSAAQAEGAPGAYDIGTQRVAWTAQSVTDWIGDAGRVHSLALEIRGFLVVGDDAWCKGHVKRKYEEGGRHMLELALWVENQRGVRVSRGVAHVSLPARTVVDA